MIKNIVFDMGNVLILFDPDVILRRYLTEEADIEIMKRDLIGSLVWRQWDEGTVEKSAFLPVCEALPRHLRALGKHLVLEQCFAGAEMPPFPETEALIRELRDNGYGIYLLSNAGQDYYEYSKGIPALRLFDFCFVSSDYKLLKPDRAIYEKFFEVTKLDRSACVFIDDMPANVQGSIDAGMDAICFTPSKAPMRVLREQLRARGVRVEA